MASPLENTFAFQLKAAHILFLREVKAIPGRKFAFDFQVKDLLIEIQGGIWRKKDGITIPQGHTTGRGITRDCEKMNLAALEGYHTMSFTAEHIKKGIALAWVQQYLAKG